MFHRSGLAIAALATALFGVVSSANASAIISATGATINSGGPGFGNIADTYNQNGLSTGYLSGVTNFDSYLASNPTHTNIFSGYEWFSNEGSSSASVTYNLGSVTSIDKLALWNEESSGIGLLDLLYSNDGVNFSSLLSNLVPTNNVLGPDYSADVFSFSAVDAQYIRFDMSDCPQPNSTFNACAIGEVAFRAADTNNVPEPGSLALLGAGLVGLVAVRKRK